MSDDEVLRAVRESRPALERLLAELHQIRQREQAATGQKLVTAVEELARELGHDPMDPAVRAIIRATLATI